MVLQIVMSAPEGHMNIGCLLNCYNVFTRRWEYLFTWKTDRAWASTCRQLIVRFNHGSSPHVSNFKFVR